jgi:hypothetical protein
MPHRRGRIGRQVQRCFVNSGGAAVPFDELTAWAYCNRRSWRWPIYRALKRYGEPTGKRGWFRPNAELLAKIRGNE